MKTVLFESHGGAEVLQYTDFPTPEAGPGQVLVRLRAAALNRMDVMVRNGWPGLELAMPHINGADGAGEVAALGPETAGRTTLQVGDRVVINANLGCMKCEACLKGQDNLCSDWHLLGETIRGTYAQFIALPSHQVHKIPEGLDFHRAAAAGLVYQTAWHSLVVRGGLTSGETVLIVGAGGGVNTACLDIARHLRARAIVVASDQPKADRARELGAHSVIDRSRLDSWSKAVYEANGRQGVDVVVDNVGTTFMTSLRCLRKGGRLLTVGNSGGARFEIDNRYIFAKHLAIIGSTMGTQADFSTVLDLVAGGALRPTIDSTYPLEEAADAQERLWKGEHFGKITLAIG